MGTVTQAASASASRLLPTTAPYHAGISSTGSYYHHYRAALGTDSPYFGPQLMKYPFREN